MQEEPDSVTMGSVPERCQSPAPLLSEGRGSFDVGANLEIGRTSPTAGIHDNAVEHSATELLSWPSAAGQLNVSSDHGTTSAVESSHSPRDGVHVKESTEHPDTGRKKKKRHGTAVSDDSKDVGPTAVQERSKHKHIEQYGTVNDDSEDLRHAAVKEQSKHQHMEQCGTVSDDCKDIGPAAVKERSKRKHKEQYGTVNDDSEDLRHAAVKVQSKHERKEQRGTVSDDSKDVGPAAIKEWSKHKHKEYLRGTVNDESEDLRDAAVKEQNKHKHKERSRETDEKNEEHKTGDVGSTVDDKNSVDDTSHSDLSRAAVKERSKHKHKERLRGTDENAEEHKTGGVGSKVNDKNNVDDTSHSDFETKQKKSASSTKQTAVTDDKVNSESTNDKRAKSNKNSAFASYEDRLRAEIGDSSRRVVRQYRHQDGIRERTCDKTSAGRRKRERKTVSVFNQFCGI